MKGKHYLPLLFSFLFPFLAYSQLSGTYTIGGINPDYATIPDAFKALTSYPDSITGPVIFNIRNGVYNDTVTIEPNYISGMSYTNNVTFQSESQDSSLVIITDTIPNQQIFFLRDYFNFKQLTFIDPTTTGIDVSGVGNNFYNCVIQGTDQFGTALLGGDTIQNCLIKGTVYGGSTVSNNIIEGDLNGGSILNNNIIKGNVFAPRGNVNAVGNTIAGNFQNAFDYIVCSKNTIGGFFTAAYGGGDIENNFFYGSADLSYSKYIFKNNIVYNDSLGAELSFEFNTNSQIINNVIYCAFGCSINSGLTITGNKCFSDFDTGEDDGDVITNNLFYKIVELQSTDYKFMFNNCIPDSNFYFYNNGDQTNNIIENNTMPSIYYGDIGTSTIKNNNYGTSTGGAYDSHPFHIDPEYISPNDIHSTNPQLIAKAIPISTVKYDIDSVKRPALPTIGANEICLSQDTLNVLCGDSIILSLCNMPASGNFTWSPATGLNNSHLAKPTLSPQASQLYTVMDSSSSYRDSFYVNVIPFHLSVGINDSLKCGGLLNLSATYNGGATYRWSPTDSLSTPDNYLTNANPAVTTTYVVTASVPGCGSSSDTITVFVNPLPTAYAYLDSVNNNYYSFLNVSTCADTYSWDFGDSTALSTVVNPIHIYGDTGLFLVTLIACNSYGCDTFSEYIYIDSVTVAGVHNYAAIDNEINIYPNPNDGLFTVSLSNAVPISAFEIYNYLGELIFRRNYNELGKASEINVDLFKHPNGVYLLKVSSRYNATTRKIILDK